MNSVHVGRHDEQSQDAIQPRGKLDITVIEHRRGVEQGFKEQYRYCGCAKNKNRQTFDSKRQQDFYCVESQSRRDIEFHVRVMHHVQTLEERHGMEQNML